MPIGSFVVDFALLSHHLVIEVDGDHHGREPFAEQDQAGTERFADRGFRLLRFSNAALTREIDTVLDTIHAALYDPDVSASLGDVQAGTPSSNPSPQGGGKSRMPDLLLELLSEEIPARMQRRAAEDLRKLVTDALVERGFLYEGARAFATPRRLALHVVGLPAKGQDVREERRGPRVGSPDKAIEGFLKAAGLASLDQARIETDVKKGEFYIAVIERPGRPTPEVLAEILPAIIRDFPWPKPCAGACNRPSPGRCAGCARSSRSSAPSGRRPRSRTWCRSRSTASAPATSREGIASWVRRP